MADPVITGARQDRSADPVLETVARDETPLECTVDTVNALRDAEAIVPQDELSLE